MLKLKIDKYPSSCLPENLRGQLRRHFPLRVFLPSGQTRLAPRGLGFSRMGSDVSAKSLKPKNS